MSGRYLLLYQYLEGRYANTVVLTFADIEALLGFILPDQARLHEEWWSNTSGNDADHNQSISSCRPDTRCCGQASTNFKCARASGSRS